MLHVLTYSTVFLLQEESVHDSLAMSVCNEVLCDPSSDIRLYSRTLSLLELSPSNPVSSVKLNYAPFLSVCLV